VFRPAQSYQEAKFGGHAPRCRQCKDSGAWGGIRLCGLSSSEATSFFVAAVVVYRTSECGGAVVEDRYVGLNLVGACRFLSLDATFKVYPDCGFNVRTPSVFQSSLRNLQLERSSGSVMRTLDVRCGGSKYLSEVLGERNSILLHIWTREVYEQDENVWPALADAFSDGFRDYRAFSKDLLGLGSDAAEVYQMYLRLVDTCDFTRVEQLYKIGCLSQWDTLMLRVALGDEAKEWNPFADQAVLCIRTYKFILFWNSVRSRLSDSALETLTALASDSPTRTWPVGTDIVKLRSMLPP